MGECLVGPDNYFGCGMSGHKVRNIPMVRGQEKGSTQAKTSDPSFDAPKRNHFYALRSRDNQEESPDVVSGILKVFSIDLYAFIDLGSTLSFVTPLATKNFDILPDVLIEPFSVTNPVGDSVVAKRVFMSCPISLPHKVTLVDLFEIDIVNFSVIVGMNFCMLICFH